MNAKVSAIRMRMLVLGAGALLVGAAGVRSSDGAEPRPLALGVGADTVLAAADLRADLAVLRSAYEALHPGLYRYNSKQEIAARFDSVDRVFSSDRTLAHAFLTLTRLTASIQCGHSYPNFYNQTDPIAGALFEASDKVPFAFRWLGNRMVVTASDSSSLLPRGTVIERINGVSTAAVLDSLMPYARADGHNDAKRVSYLEVQGDERYHAFDVLYPLLFRSRDSVYSLSVRRTGSTRVVAVRLKAFTAAERRAFMKRVAPPASSDTSATAPQWDFRMREGLGVLRMPTWALYDSKWPWQAYTDSLMQAITTRGLSDLVLDLRNNEGGVDAGNAIIAHLIDKPITLPKYVRHVRYRKIPADLRPVLATWDRSFDDWGEKAVGPVDSMFYRLVRYDDDTSGGEIIQPKAPRYRGRVWVIVGAANSSATFQFALAMKQSKLGTLVGQPTGGNQRGINGGAFYFVRLPRTKLEVDLPLIAGFPTTARPDAGVVPDVSVGATAGQVAVGADVELAAIGRALLRDKRR